jgi:ribonuclease VapC
LLEFLEREVWPPVNTSRRGLKTKFLSALIGVHRWPKSISSHALSDFGRGRHPARLSFGDCIAYAAAAVTGMPLLYTGNDFAQTDIPAA